MAWAPRARVGVWNPAKLLPLFCREGLPDRLHNLCRMGGHAAGWRQDRRDSADAVRAVVVLIAWVAVALLLFVAQGDAFLRLAGVLLLVASTAGGVGSYAPEDGRMGKWLVRAFGWGLASIAILVLAFVAVMLPGLATELAESRCGDAAWRVAKYCSGSAIGPQACRRVCVDQVSQGLSRGIIGCAAVAAVVLSAGAVRVLRASRVLFPTSSDRAARSRSSAAL